MFLVYLIISCIICTVYTSHERITEEHVSDQCGPSVFNKLNWTEPLY